MLWYFLLLRLMLKENPPTLREFLLAPFQLFWAPLSWLFAKEVLHPPLFPTLLSGARVSATKMLHRL